MHSGIVTPPAMRLTGDEIKLLVFIFGALVLGALVKEYRATHRPVIPAAPVSSRVPRL
jgi:hypothetical protein